MRMSMLNRNIGGSLIAAASMVLFACSAATGAPDVGDSIDGGDPRCDCRNGRVIPFDCLCPGDSFCDVTVGDVSDGGFRGRAVPVGELRQFPGCGLVEYRGLMGAGGTNSYVFDGATKQLVGFKLIDDVLFRCAPSSGFKAWSVQAGQVVSPSCAMATCTRSPPGPEGGVSCN